MLLITFPLQYSTSSHVFPLYSYYLHLLYILEDCLTLIEFFLYLHSMTLFPPALKAIKSPFSCLLIWTVPLPSSWRLCMSTLTKITVKYRMYIPYNLTPFLFIVLFIHCSWFLTPCLQGLNARYLFHNNLPGVQCVAFNVRA